MNSPVEEIKRRLGIEEVVSSYIELKPAGKALKAICPFHSEKTPSFTVSSERGSFYCFGCNKGGDIFTFVEEFEGVDFKGALKILAERAGVDLRQYKGIYKGRAEREKHDRLYELLETAKNLYRAQLGTNKVAQTYITERGVLPESQELFEIGYAPDAWSYLLDALREKGFSEGEIEQAGLSIKKESGGYYDRFRNRIIFPINDSSGRTVGFSGRTLETGKDVAKYINSPETPLFKKRDVLYGIDKAKLAIRKLNFSILVEGQMDLVLAHQALFRNTVATSGTALRGRESEGEEGVSNLELVKRISKNIVIAFDSDSAGIKASIKNARLALSLGMDVKIAALPEGSDPADVIKKDLKEWKRIVRESVDVVEFQLQTIEKAAKSKKDVLKGVRSELFETISAVQSKLEQEHYLGVVSEKLGLRNETLLEEFERFQKNDRLQSVQKLKTKEEADQNGEERGQERYALASHIFIFKRNKEAEEGEAEHFEKEYAGVFEETPEDTLEKLDAAVRERYIFEIEADNKTILEEKTYIEQLLKRITIGELEQRAKQLLNKLKEAEDEADKSTAEALFKEYSRTLSEIENIKQQS